jgi:DNA-binding MarR family transcriptional regulator
MKCKAYYDINLSKTITAVIKKLSKKEDEMLSPFSLTHSHARYLENVHRFKIVTMADLTELSGTDKANTTRVVKELLKQDIVVKSGGERKFSLTLTEKGRQIAEHFKQQKEKFMKNVFKDFTKEELQNLKALLQKLFLGTTSALKG